MRQHREVMAMPSPLVLPMPRRASKSGVALDQEDVITVFLTKTTTLVCFFCFCFFGRGLGKIDTCSDDVERIRAT
jgi:hypothetical protein